MLCYHGNRHDNICKQHTDTTKCAQISCQNGVTGIRHNLSNCVDCSMAELHILGQIQGASNFKEKSSLYCRYSFQHGPNWSVVSGCPEGQTVAGKPDYNKSIVWAQPLDLHFVTRGIQGWPKLILQIFCLDAIGRSWVVGYGVCSLPAVPGTHTVQVPCWSLAATTLTDRIHQYFLGGSHQLITSDIINFGADRYKLNTQSKGVVKVQIDVILRNLSQFGVEYK